MSLVLQLLFDESSGTTAADSSGNSNTGTLVNGPTFVAGHAGNAISLNGSTQYVTVANSSSLNPVSAITVSAWVYANDWNSGRRIVSKGDSDNQYEIFAPAANVVRFLVSGYPAQTAIAPSTGQWHLLTGTYDGSYFRFYIDGALASASALYSGATLSTSSDPLTIGTLNGGSSSNCFNGKIDDVRVYDVALSAGQIAALYSPPIPFSRPLAVASAESVDVSPAHVVFFRPAPAVPAPRISFARPLWIASTETADAPNAQIILFRPAPAVPPPRIPFARPLRVAFAETADAPDASFIVFAPPPFRPPPRFCTFPLHVWIAIDEAAYSRDLPRLIRFIAPPVNTFAASGRVAGFYRVADPTLDRYELYRGVGAEPDLTAGPWQTSTSLPITTGTLAAGSVTRLVIRRRNAWNLVSQNNASTVFDLSGAGLMNPTPPSDPDNITIAPASAGAALLTATYNYGADGANAADSFVVYLRTDGSDPNPTSDTPALVSPMVQSDGTARLSFKTPTYAEGTMVKVIVRTRRGSSPAVFSTGSTVHSTIVTYLGPLAVDPAAAFITSAAQQAQ